MLTTYSVVCEKCGAVAICTVQCGAQLVCLPCVERACAPQGETARLFQPAPAVMPGQLGFGS